ncbi:hypothetical protein DVH24_011944 [Malus domestica]|uniref:Uncharacterized protein n=1 Tax=Malus domestica TaxID=3750 RepID=A0A498JBQ0_MALDO|nr:hypothetical protein DVH24_011944 [Malus domestica]
MNRGEIIIKMVVCWKGCRTVKEDILKANVPSPVETSIATIIDESERLKIDTKHLRELSFRVGSVYQFIGKLLIQPDNEKNSSSDSASSFINKMALARSFSIGIE